MNSYSCILSLNCSENRNSVLVITQLYLNKLLSLKPRSSYQLQRHNGIVTLQFLDYQYLAFCWPYYCNRKWLQQNLPIIDHNYYNTNANQFHAQDNGNSIVSAPWQPQHSQHMHVLQVQIGQLDSWHCINYLDSI